MENVYITKASSETTGLGKELAKQVKNGGILALYGDLGSGKTTFVQGLAKGLGITKRIISPTFIVVRNYELGIMNQGSFYHIDLYRVDNEQGMKGLGLEEIFTDPGNIIAIEWAEKLGDLLPKKRWEIGFEYVDEEKRKITIKKF